ncbi:hypothetical protein HKD37_09G024793 [Glycine soja]
MCIDEDEVLDGSSLVPTHRNPRQAKVSRSDYMGGREMRIEEYPLARRLLASSLAEFVCSGIISSFHSFHRRARRSSKPVWFPSKKWTVRLTMKLSRSLQSASIWRKWRSGKCQCWHRGSGVNGAINIKKIHMWKLLVVLLVLPASQRNFYLQKLPPSVVHRLGWDP